MERYTMSKDLNAVVGNWEFDPIDEARNVRRVVGDDGRPKIQIRVRNGLIQWEASGRPDGTQPFGKPSLLDHYQELINARGSGLKSKRFKLTRKQYAEVAEEMMDYYNRRVIFFQLGDYEGALHDAYHNLALMDIVRDHVDDKKAVMSHEKYRAFVLMDYTRAGAMIALEAGHPRHALDEIDKGMAEIKHFYHQHHRTDLVSSSQELQVLEDLKAQLRQKFNIPLTRKEVLAHLRHAKDRAIEKEDYEKAAKLRDQIKHLEAGRQNHSDSEWEKPS